MKSVMKILLHKNLPEYLHLCKNVFLLPDAVQTSMIHSNQVLAAQIVCQLLGCSPLVCCPIQADLGVKGNPDHHEEKMASVLFHHPAGVFWTVVRFWVLAHVVVLHPFVR